MKIKIFIMGMICLFLFCCSGKGPESEEGVDPLSSSIKAFLIEHPEYGNLEKTSDMPDWASEKRKKVTTSKGEYLFYFEGTEVASVYKYLPDGGIERIFEKKEGMMELVILGAFVGAVFATAGGFLQQRYQTIEDQKRNDKNILIKALDILLAMSAPARRSMLDSKTFEILMEKVHASADKRYGFTSALYRLSFEFRRKESTDMAIKIRQFISRGGMQGISELRKEIEKKIRNG